MTWHRRLPVTDDEFDRGNLNLVGAAVENRRFDCCGVSLSRVKRSTFIDCTFRNLRLHRCSLGGAIFERCHFENVWVTDGHSARGSLFLECQFRGTINGINFGFSDEGGLHPESMIRDNTRRAANASYCLDLSEATCTALAFDSGPIAEKVRFRERQCLILTATNLAEVATRLFHTTTDRSLQLLLVSCMQSRISNGALALVEQEAEPRLNQLIEALEAAGIGVRTTPLC